MTHNEIAERLGLPANTNHRNLAARALRHHCAGGDEIIDAKEWAAGVANAAERAKDDPRRATYRDEIEARRAIATQALGRLAAIQRAMLASLARSKGIPQEDMLRYL